MSNYDLGILSNASTATPVVRNDYSVTTYPNDSTDVFEAVSNQP